MNRCLFVFPVAMFKAVADREQSGTRAVALATQCQWKGLLKNSSFSHNWIFGLKCSRVAQNVFVSASCILQEQQTHRCSPAGKSALRQQYSQLSVFWITPAVPTPVWCSALEPICLQTAVRVGLRTEAQPAESLWLSEHLKASLLDKRSCTAMVRTCLSWPSPMSAKRVVRVLVYVWLLFLVLVVLTNRPPAG